MAVKLLSTPAPRKKRSKAKTKAKKGELVLSATGMLPSSTRPALKRRVSPVVEWISWLTHAYDLFNLMLWDCELPDNTVLTVGCHERMDIAGQVLPFLWGDEELHEINLGYEGLTQPPAAILQTLVHEMCHVHVATYDATQTSLLRDQHGPFWKAQMKRAGLKPMKRVGGYADRPILLGAYAMALPHVLSLIGPPPHRTTPTSPAYWARLHALPVE
jgi:hypothetical protein